MKYRDAKKLKPGDQVQVIEDKSVYMVADIEVYGSIKKVRIYCEKDGDPSDTYILYNDDIEFVG